MSISSNRKHSSRAWLPTCRRKSQGLWNSEVDLFTQSLYLGLKKSKVSSLALGLSDIQKDAEGFENAEVLHEDVAVIVVRHLLRMKSLRDLADSSHVRRGLSWSQSEKSKDGRV